MNLERGWMYDRLDGRGGINSNFVIGVNNFIQFACSQLNRMSGNNIRCPCKKCHNIKYLDVEIVKYHLFHFGFVENYFIWKHQGEKDLPEETSSGNDLNCGAQPKLGNDNPYLQMILDTAGPNFDHGSGWQPYSYINSEFSHPYEPSNEEEPYHSMEEEPNRESQTDIDQCEAYYEAAGGEKRKKIYGLGSEGKSYYASKFSASSESNTSSSTSPSISQSTPLANMSEFMNQLIPALTDHFLPIVLQRVHEVISSSSPTNDPSVVTPIVPPATTNAEKVAPLVSDDDHSP